MILFSILIANYNNDIFFEECYKSIINQTYTNWEVIIVDDCSTDNSIDLINSLIKDDSRFHQYFNDINYGCGYSKRKCADLANGEICGFLDPDDALTPNALEIMVEYHAKYDDAALIYSDYYYCKNTFKNIIPIKNDNIPENLNYLIGMYKYKIGHFATFKKKYYKNSIGINPILKRAVDQDLYLKCEEQGKIIHIDDFLYLYRIHKNGISLYDNNIKAISWHIFVTIEACRRREIDFEDILSGLLSNIFYTDDKIFGKWMLNTIFGRLIFKILRYSKFIT